MIPARFWGAWTRADLVLDGVAQEETARVVWVQGPSRFADLRVARADGVPVACFAGTTSWDPAGRPGGDGRLRWARAFDLRPAGAEDEGDVAWDGPDLLESGVFPFPGTDGPVPYVERWRRLADDAPIQAWAADTGVAVQAGSHAVVVAVDPSGLSAGCFRGEGDGWVLAFGIGAGALTVPTEAAPRGWRLVEASDGAVAR